MEWGKCLTYSWPSFSSNLAFICDCDQRPFHFSEADLITLLAGQHNTMSVTTLALPCWKCDWQLVCRPAHQSEPFLTCLPRPGVRAATVNAGKPNKAWHSTPSPGLMMSYHKYPALTAPRLHKPRGRVCVCVCVPISVAYRAEEWQGMFARHPLLFIVKLNQTTQHRSCVWMGGCVPLTVCSFSFHKQVHPEGDGALMVKVLVQDGRGLWSMKQLQCFNKKLMVASSISDIIVTLGRLIRWYKVWPLTWPAF